MGTVKPNRRRMSSIPERSHFLAANASIRPQERHTTRWRWFAASAASYRRLRSCSATGRTSPREERSERFRYTVAASGLGPGKRARISRGERGSGLSSRIRRISSLPLVTGRPRRRNMSECLPIRFP
jgi:hypothetical protein